MRTESRAIPMNRGQGDTGDWGGCCGAVDMDQRRRASAGYCGGGEWRLAMRVRDVMTSPVISIAPGSTVLEAGRLMLPRGLSGLAGLDQGGSPGGIVTGGDFLP